MREEAMIGCGPSARWFGSEPLSKPRGHTRHTHHTARQVTNLQVTALPSDLAGALEVEAEFREEYPVTINDPGQVAFASGVVGDVFSEGRFSPMPDPVADAEDFSQVLDRVPGAYLFLGAHTGDRADRPDNHSAHSTVDDSVMPDGALLHAQLALRFLRETPA